MNVENAVYPNQERMIALLAEGHEGKVRMINLLKFKDQAEYEDGRDTSLTGQGAYRLYSELMIPYVTKAGGTLIDGGTIVGMIIGDVESCWDTFALVEYPTLAAFVEIVTSPEVREFAVHRHAGLAGQLLIPVI